MAILYQRRNEHMIINGWYGKCHDDNGALVDVEDCPDFDLISTGNNVRAVYWFQDDLVAQSYTRGAPIYLQDFTRLKCGGAYIIFLEKGEGQVNIPHFVPSYSNVESQQRISNCFSDSLSTPTPVIAPFADKVSVDSVCPIYEQHEGGECRCHVIHLTIGYDTEVSRNINLSVEKTGVTQPLFQSYGNVVIGKGTLSFLLRPEVLDGDAVLEDVDRIAVFLTNETTTLWSDRITTDISLESEWDCDLIDNQPTPTPIQSTPTPEQPTPTPTPEQPTPTPTPEQPTPTPTPEQPTPTPIPEQTPTPTPEQTPTPTPEQTPTPTPEQTPTPTPEQTPTPTPVFECCDPTHKSVRPNQPSENNLTFRGSVNGTLCWQELTGVKQPTTYSCSVNSTNFKIVISSNITNNNFRLIMDNGDCYEAQLVHSEYEETNQFEKIN
jgi:hypothetical protein